jgi:dephospho-CoA kinase
LFVIALTGGIGSGKSLAADEMRARGALVLDLDPIAHEVLAPGATPTLAVAEAFGADILDAHGAIDRAKLADRAFVSDETCRLLNDIVHPAVLTAIEAKLDTLRDCARPPEVVVVEVPLLVEAPSFARLAIVVLAISAPEQARVDRCVAAGRSREDVLRRMACQATDPEREAMADRVIVNTGTRDDFIRAVGEFWEDTVRPNGA